jgi:hypothetical protein
MIFMLGLTFLHKISDDRPSTDVGKIYKYFDLINYFIGAQGVAFMLIAVMAMTAILTVALVFPN